MSQEDMTVYLSSHLDETVDLAPAEENAVLTDLAMRSASMLGGRYELLYAIGKGGMGQVYLARDHKLGKNWAIKEIPFQTGEAYELIAEPEILKKIDHYRIPRIVDVEKSATYLYIVEDYFAGKSLQNIIKECSTIVEADAIKWAKQLCEVMIYLHSVKPNPVIYRDMKPGNIIIDEKGEAKLIDFGIAREYKQDNNSDTSYIGTRGFAAPEQYGGAQTDQRTDVYGFGATLYNMLTGKTPTEPPYDFLPLRKLNSKLSNGIEKIVAKCVKSNPVDRYQTFIELLYDLEHIEQIDDDIRRAKRKKRMAKLMAAAAVLLVLACGYEYTQYAERRDISQFNALVAKAEAAGNSGKYDASEKLFKQAYAARNDEEALLDIGSLRLHRGDSSGAADYLSGCLNRGELTASSRYYRLMGSAFLAMQDYHQASFNLEKSIAGGSQELGNDYALALRDLAVADAKQGKIEEAHSILKQLLQASGKNDPAVHFVYGQLALQVNDMKTARQEMLKAIELSPQEQVYRIMLSRSLLDNAKKSGDSRSLLSAYQEALQLLYGQKGYETSIDLLNEIGSCEYELALHLSTSNPQEKRAAYEKSLNAFQQLEELGIRSENTLVNIAVIEEQLGDWKSAKSSLHDAVAAYPDSSRASLTFGLMLAMHHDYGASRQYLLKVINMNAAAADVGIAKSQLAELDKVY